MRILKKKNLLIFAGQFEINVKLDAKYDKIIVAKQSEPN